MHRAGGFAEEADSSRWRSCLGSRRHLLAAGVQKRAKDLWAGPWIGGSLGVPLNTQQERAIGRFDGFDDAVGRFADDLQSAGILERLDMVAVYSSGEASSRDLMDRTVTVLVRGLEVVGEVLIQTAARMEAEHLHPEADAQDRDLGMGSFEGIEKLEFEGLANRIDERGLGVNGFAEVRGVGIVAAAEDHTVEVRQHGCSRPRERKEGDRDPPAFGDRSRVSTSKAGLVLHEVGGHPDERKIVVGSCDAWDSKIRAGAGRQASACTGCN